MTARACTKCESSKISHPSTYYPILSRPACIEDEMGISCLYLHKDAETFVSALFNSAQQQNGPKPSGDLKLGSLRKLMASLKSCIGCKIKKLHRLYTLDLKARCGHFHP
jgi:hypothetical protein